MIIYQHSGKREIWQQQSAVSFGPRTRDSLTPKQEKPYVVTDRGPKMRGRHGPRASSPPQADVPESNTADVPTRSTVNLAASVNAESGVNLTSSHRPQLRSTRMCRSQTLQTILSASPPATRGENHRRTCVSRGECPSTFGAIASSRYRCQQQLQRRTQWSPRNQGGNGPGSLRSHP